MKNSTKKVSRAVVLLLKKILFSPVTGSRSAVFVLGRRSKANKQSEDL